MAFFGDGAVRIWRSDDRMLRLYRPQNDEEIKELRFSPDGSLLTGQGQRTVYLWCATDSAYLHALPQRDLIGFPTNDTLITTDGTTTQLWRLNGWRVRANEVSGEGVAFTDDGQTLVTTTDAGFSAWRVADASRLHDVAFAQPRFADVTVSPDGSVVGTIVEGVAALLRVADGAPLVTLAISDTQVRSLVFAPDGRTVAALTQPATVGLWRVAGGTLLRSLPLTPRSPHLTYGACVIALCCTRLYGYRSVCGTGIETGCKHERVIIVFYPLDDIVQDVQIVL